MKSSFCYLFLVVFFFACRTGTSVSGEGVSISDSLAQKAMGTYLGRFGESPITVAINYISGRTVSGYSIHKGLRRNFNGEASLQGASLDFSLREPGDNLYDGNFSFALDTASWKIKGKWMPLNKGKNADMQLMCSRSDKQQYFNWDRIWTSVHGTDFRDSILSFQQDGICVFRFYERPADSTSQLVTITGNYESDEKNGTYWIEWEKNSYYPLTMNLQLVKEKKRGHQTEYLCGNGLKLTSLILF